MALGSERYASILIVSGPKARVAVTLRTAAVGVGPAGCLRRGMPRPGCSDDGQVREERSRTRRSLRPGCPASLRLHRCGRVCPKRLDCFPHDSCPVPLPAVTTASGQFEAGKSEKRSCCRRREAHGGRRLSAAYIVLPNSDTLSPAGAHAALWRNIEIASAHGCILYPDWKTTAGRLFYGTFLRRTKGLAFDVGTLTVSLWRIPNGDLEQVFFMLSETKELLQQSVQFMFLKGPSYSGVLHKGCS